MVTSDTLGHQVDDEGKNDHAPDGADVDRADGAEEKPVGTEPTGSAPPVSAVDDAGNVSNDAPETDPVDAPGRDAAVAEALQAVEQQLLRFHERSSRQEEIIREMQARITSLQGDQVQALLKPALQRFAGLHAQALEAAVASQERGERASNDFAYFAAAVEEALGLLDLDSVDARVGGVFDSVAHHATGTVVTGDPALDKTIQRVTRQGFGYTGAARVVLPAQVVVYRYDETFAAALPQPEETTDIPPASAPAEHPHHKETLS